MPMPFGHWYLLIGTRTIAPEENYSPVRVRVWVRIRVRKRGEGQFSSETISLEAFLYPLKI